ncbi:putative nucleotide-binding alpha-beta plait domain superfamily, RNA-binding domain superfamily [Helianthus anomalus]
MSATASSSLISITTTLNTSSNLHSLKTLKTLFSIPKSPFKTPNFSLNFKPNHLTLSTLFRSASPSYQTTQIQQTPEAELSEIEEELENDDVFEEEDEEESEPKSLPANFTSETCRTRLRQQNWHKYLWNWVTNGSKGFAFVTMASVQEAKEAITNLCGVV